MQQQSECDDCEACSKEMIKLQPNSNVDLTISIEETFMIFMNIYKNEHLQLRTFPVSLTCSTTFVFEIESIFSAKISLYNCEHC